MSIGSVTFSTGSCGYSSGGCSFCEDGRAATGAEGQRKAPPPGKTPSSGSSEQLSEEEQQQVAELVQRDREVRAHEAAHVAAGGGFVRGGAQFSYQSGPDGKRYAVGGEVSIDTSPVKDNPAATIAKMQAVRGAALAPANPSGQDRSVAAAASAQEAQARRELNAEQTAATGGNDRKPSITMPRGYNNKAEAQSNETAFAQLDMAA